MNFSKFASRFSSDLGIVQLMDDLGDAMAGNQDVLMLGGGNPGYIPEVQQSLCDEMRRIVENPARFCRLIGDYDRPQGNIEFITALARQLNQTFHWGVTEQNIGLTTGGSQSGFFMLFNLLAGEFEDGSRKQIMLPLTPEYIGYSDVGIVGDLFYSFRPEIEKTGKYEFKYHINFDDIGIKPDTGAICVSRPTNPTGNVLTDGEISNLMSMAESSGIPLIVDNAYGAPFPNILFAEVSPVWNENVIFCMSLSKIGLPGARTGIVVAHKDIIQIIARMNAVINLALGSLGPALVRDLLTNGEMVRLCDRVIKPFYKKKVERAIEAIHREFFGINYLIHKPEGAIFLWIWLPDLPVTSEELYQRLKEKGVLIIPGHYFFPGLDDDWRHRHECIRLTYSMSDETVLSGVKLIAEEVRNICNGQ